MLKQMHNSQSSLFTGIPSLFHLVPENWGVAVVETPFWVKPGFYLSIYPTQTKKLSACFRTDMSRTVHPSWAQFIHSRGPIHEQYTDSSRVFVGCRPHGCGNGGKRCRPGDRRPYDGAGRGQADAQGYAGGRLDRL